MTLDAASKPTLSTDVVIVGGGLAGITCAMGLRDSGLDVLLVERDKILGGRASSWVDEKTGDPVHIGPHIFLQLYENMWKLLDMLGTRDRIVWLQHAFKLVDGQDVTETDLVDRMPPFHFRPARDPRMNTRDLLSNLPVTLYSLRVTEEDIQRLDDVNALAFLKSFGVSDNSIRYLWNFISMSIMNIPVEVCSAGALMRFHAGTMTRRQVGIGFPDGGLGDLFAPPAQAAFDRAGWRILFNTKVRRFLGTPGRATGVELEDGRRISARYCVSAVPPDALFRIVPPGWMHEYPGFSELTQFRACPYISTYLWFDRKITDLQCWARSYSSTSLNLDFYDLSNINRGWESRPSLITCNCIYSYRAESLSDEEMVEQTLAELSEFLPEARTAKLVHSVVHRIPSAITCPFPGMERRRLPVETSIGGLLLAGDWIQTGLPASMEGAVRSGWLAAESIWRDEGRPRKLAADVPKPEGLAGVINRLGARLPRVRRRIPLRL